MENHTNKTYQERMNKTALSKFSNWKHPIARSNCSISALLLTRVHRTSTTNRCSLHRLRRVTNRSKSTKENDIDFFHKRTTYKHERWIRCNVICRVFFTNWELLVMTWTSWNFWAMLDKALKPDGVSSLSHWTGPKSGLHHNHLKSPRAVHDEIHMDKRTC